MNIILDLVYVAHQAIKQLLPLFFSDAVAIHWMRPCCSHDVAPPTEPDADACYSNEACETINCQGQS